VYRDMAALAPAFPMQAVSRATSLSAECWVILIRISQLQWEQEMLLSSLFTTWGDEIRWILLK